MKHALMAAELFIGAASISTAHLYFWPHGEIVLGLLVDIMGVTFTAMGVSTLKKVRP